MDLIFLKVLYTNEGRNSWSAVAAGAVCSRLDLVCADCGDAVSSATPACLSACAAPLLQGFGLVFGMQHTPESWEKPLFCLSAVLGSSLETLVVNPYRRTAERARRRDQLGFFLDFPMNEDFCLEDGL